MLVIYTICEGKTKVASEMLHRFTAKEYDKIVQEYDIIYPEYKGEKYPHYVDWLYEEWCKPFDQKCKSNLYQVMLEAGFQL